MNHVPFHLTRMGVRFFEHTAPALARELERLNSNLEKLLANVAAPTQSDQADQTATSNQPPEAR